MQIHNQTTYNLIMNDLHKMPVLINHIIHFIRSSKNGSNVNKNENITVSPKKIRPVEINCDAPLQVLTSKPIY